MRSFFVKETVPYLRTQRSFFSTKFLEVKFLLSLACAVGVMCCFVFPFDHWVQYLFFRILHLKEWVGGFPPFLV